MNHLTQSAHEWSLIVNALIMWLVYSLFFIYSHCWYSGGRSEIRGVGSSDPVVCNHCL